MPSAWKEELRAVDYYSAAPSYSGSIDAASRETEF